MLEIIYILILAVAVDLIFGEPENRFHPVAWLGKLIELLFKNDFISSSKNRILKKIYGMIAALMLVLLVFFIVYWALILAYGCKQIIFILISVIILKFTFSIRGMKEHAEEVLENLKNKNINKARISVSMIVGRDTKNLNEKQIVSAAVESISENMVDGIMSPIFYFMIAYLLTNSIGIAVSFAAAFRTASTLDSMAGYKNERFIDLGWFSARLDDALNYVPARLSPVFFLNLNSIKIVLRDHSKTPSPNSGFPMAAMAGFLGVSLEKAGYYMIGDEKEQLEQKHIKTALQVMERSTIIFILFNIFLIIFLL